MLRSATESRKTRLFLSYTMNDRDAAQQLKREARDKWTVIELVDYPVVDDPGANWKRRGEQLLRSCDATVCLVGARTSSSSPVEWELRRTASLRKPIVGLRVRQSEGMQWPLFETLGLTVYDWVDRERALDRVVSEVHGSA